ncbi:hypothetical protein BGW38_001075 [Lunasporangiospora selenospora]|uniref:Peptide chain release factor N(5)-glutamine methyltransferase n=1 Tax=Lunasporangiospora selenospora TaxID=979761 RepID=A0A9P6FTZ4_9FUNG|nr:hypothetical protein BGW38_001075 [Lunasporangiospora selenospora]
MKELQAIASEEDKGARLWRFVMQHWKAIVQSREQTRKCFKRGEISVNGTVAEATKILEPNDVVRIKFDKRAAHESIYGKEKLEVRYEDEHLAVVVKPSGKNMVTLGYMLQFSLKPSSLEKIVVQDGEAELDVAMDHVDSEERSEVEESEDEGDFQTPFNVSAAVGQQKIPCAVHGLERAATGLVFVAKTKETHQSLLEMYKTGKITRTYRAICHGSWVSPKDSAVKETDSDKDNRSALPEKSTSEADSIRSIRLLQETNSNEAGRLSTLDIEVLSPYQGVNIRRHMLALQHPVVGDSNHTKPLKSNRSKGLMSALLSVQFVHPSTGQLICVEIEEPTKFEQLRQREEKAYSRRLNNDLEELRKGGLEAPEDYDRKSNKPIAYMVGEKDFFGLRFKVSPATLIPRLSTETLVRTALTLTHDHPVKILDVGTGSGCLLLALLKELSSSTGVGVDISQDALEVAHANKVLHSMEDRVSFQMGDMSLLHDTPGLRQSFDLLVCNPPYLNADSSSKVMTQFVGTEYEPPVALFAENRGYGAYEMLAKSIQKDLESTQTPHVLAPDARVLLEIGSGMGEHVKEIFSFLRYESSALDTHGFERCLVFAVPNQTTDTAPQVSM